MLLLLVAAYRGHANKVGEVMANRICLVSLPLRGRIDKLDTIANPEELKAYLLDVAEDDTLKGFELNCLMYQPLGLHGTYKVEGIDRLGDGQGYGGQSSPLKSPRPCPCLISWVWCGRGLKLMCGPTSTMSISNRLMFITSCGLKLKSMTLGGLLQHRCLSQVGSQFV